MNHNDSLHDDALFDRLVDGELTGEERRRLLESLDTRPEGWRRCALAFLEAQSWREELGQVARAAHPLHDASEKPTELPSTASQPKTNRWVAAQLLAIAAGLVIAFGLGWMQHGRGIPVADSTANTGEQIADANPAPSVPAPKPGKAGDALTLYVRDETGRMQPVRVPLVDAGTLDEQLGVKFQPGIPDALRNQLKDRGFTVQSKQQYAPLWLENGRPMIVPVEDTKIVPVSDRVY
jgi:hypothetical protein